MFDALTRRSFLTPAVAFTFIPMAVTGLLMLFHVNFPGLKDIHNWVGLAFVIFSAFHIAINWKQLVFSLKNKDSRIALSVAVMLILVCLVVGISSERGERRHLHRAENLFHYSSNE